MYTLLLDQLSAAVATERQVAAVLLAAGAKRVTLPTFEQARADLDRALFAEPDAESPEMAELHEALGLR